VVFQGVSDAAGTVFGGQRVVVGEGLIFDDFFHPVAFALDDRATD
jgi:hypothetical protein